jgi:hypothetical protein
MMHTQDRKACHCCQRRVICRRCAPELFSCIKAGCPVPDAIHSDGENAGPARAGRPHRRPRQAVRRERTIRFDVSEAEHAEVAGAAGRAGLTYGAFAAEATLAAARGTVMTPDALLREVMSLFGRAVGHGRKTGGLFNQAVRAMNATGQPSRDLLPYAAQTARATARLEEIGEELRARLVATMRARGGSRGRRPTDDAGGRSS